MSSTDSTSHEGPEAGGRRHRPRKRFGQHFLHERSTIERIVEAVAPSPDDALIEIGPGEGALTSALLGRGGQLVAVEIDRDLAASLPGRLGGRAGRLRILRQDALALDLDAPWPTGPTVPGLFEPPYRLVGNLPYNITSPLLFHLLGQRTRVRDMYFMVQREMAERLAARAGERSWGRLAAMVRPWMRVRKLFSVHPGAFRPPPRVWSTFVALEPWQAPRVEIRCLPCYERIVRAAFSQRRKKIRNALGALLEVAAIERAGVAPDARAEQICEGAFEHLARGLHQQVHPLESEDRRGGEREGGG